MFLALIRKASVAGWLYRKGVGDKWKFHIKGGEIVPTSQVLPKEVKLFHSGSGQAVSIPAGFELQGDKALVHREGNKLIVEPASGSMGLLGLLAEWAKEPPLGPEDNFADIDESLLSPKDANI